MGKKGKRDFQFKKEYIIYSILGVIILFLGVFVFNNYNKCHVYSLSSSNGDFKVANGVLVLTNQKSILKINNFEYTGSLENIYSIKLTLCVDNAGRCKALTSLGANAAEGMDLKDYMKDVSIDINEEKGYEVALTEDVKKKMINELYILVEILNSDGNIVYDDIYLDIDSQYNNNKLFY